MKKSAQFIVVFLLFVFLTSCNSVGTGTLTGTITGGDEPLSGVQIILCEVPQDGGEEHLICTLNAAPTTISDADGSFELTEVPAGTYIVMYGLPGILHLVPEEWDGLSVTRGSFCMDGGQNSVCEIKGVEPSLFWSEGALRVGNEIMGLTYQDYEEQPGVVILATAAEGSAGQGAHIFVGTVQSNYAGISANINAGQYTPEVEMIRDTPATVTIEVPLD